MTAYVGSELALFSEARTWKRYFARHLRPYIGQQVAEVGAGIGATTRFLCRGTEQSWVCLEPDPRLAAEIEAQIRSRAIPALCRVQADTLSALSAGERFDTILYIDVLEHIEDHAAEVAVAAEHLVPGGRLIVLAPAHQWLFSPFDAVIGHYRRYDHRTLRTLTPPRLTVLRCFYLDAVGLFASLANTLMLKAAMPTSRQIAIWDRVMVPLSRVVDPMIGYTLGKSVVIVWEKGRT